MKKIFLLCSLPLALSANSFFNGSFELGTDGFAVERELRTDVNPSREFIPLKLSAGAPGAGRYALAVENSRAEYFSVFSKEFRLKPSTRYRLRAKVRSSKENTPLNLRIFKVDQKWLAYTKTCNAGTEWRDFEYVFTTEEREGHGWHYLVICPPDVHAVPEASFYIDDLRLDPVDSVVPDRTEAVAVADKQLYLKGERADVSLKLYNPVADYSGNVTVNGTDEYTGKTLFSETFPVKLAHGETKVLPLKPWKLDRFGGVRITVSGASLSSHDGFFAVIGKYEAKPFDIFRDPVVGFNGGVRFLRAPQRKVPAYEVHNAPFETRFALFAAAGCRILRDHDGGARGVDWPVVEAERGKFDFSPLDRQMELYKKYNITLFPVMGESFIDNLPQTWRQQSFPEWVKKISKRIDSPNTMADARGRVIYPPVDLFENYIEQTVKHLKGRVPVYEIVNEPNLFLSPEGYVRYLKAAHDAIRRADPAAKISGFCITSDFGTDAGPWFEACVKAGGLKYVDAMGFHPYGSRKLGSIIPADQAVANIRATLAAYGKPDMPLWNTELYYLGENVGRKGCEDAVNTADDVIQRFLVDAGEGVGQSIAFHMDILWKRLLTPHMWDGHNYHELVPSELFVACNTLARLFEGAKPVKKIRHPYGVICYVFRKDGKLIAAVWEYQSKKGVHADFSKFEVMDLFGNAEKSCEKELTAAPFYLTQGKLSDAEFLAELEKLPLRLDKPVTGSGIARRVGDTLFVSLHNDSGKEESGIAGVTGGGIAAVAPVRFSIPARSSLPVEIPVRKIKSNGGKPELVLVLKNNTFRTPLEIVENQLIPRSFKLPNAEGTIEFGNGAITVTMRVKDATDAGVSGTRSPWETDCVEFFFDTDPLFIAEHNPQAYTDNNFRLFITPRDGRKLHTMGVDAKNCKLDLKPEADGYSFVLTVAAKTGKYLGFDVKIDDSDGKTVKEFPLGNGKELYKNRCNFSIAK